MVSQAIKVNTTKKNGFHSKKSLGPIDNLESYVQPDWWKRIFNSIYLKTDGDVVEDTEITGKEIDLFIQVFQLQPDDYILDLACGQGRHSLELARRGYKNVYGLDRSHYLIKKAKNNNLNEGFNANFREGDARKLPFSVDFFDKVMILGNSFGYFETMDDDLRILKEVIRVLKPNGRFLIDVADGNFLRDNFQERSWEWIDKKYFVCRERSLSNNKDRLISREVVTHVKKGIIVDQFYAERLYTQEVLERLLKSAGFQNIGFHGEITPDSKRNQDLGMMARRILSTSQIIKQWAPVRKPRTEVKNIVVLLGDPNKPDKIKPSYVFDEDDFQTVQKLKSALFDLKNYRFCFLDNHNIYISELMKMKGKIDYILNFCDEGFRNDANKELHVPALLEMLGIPYTGSGPQCLAYCYDKSLVRGIAKEMGILVPEAFFIKPEDNVFDLQIGFPVIVKPNFGDSSFGITAKNVCNNIKELSDAILDIRIKFGYDKPILVEEFLSGSDLSLGVIGNPAESYTVLPIIEEDYSLLSPELPKICGYEAKWMPQSPYASLRSIPAKLPESVEKSIERDCLKLFERLDCRDYCRFDWRLDHHGNPKLLEVNPNPGWCWDGHLAKMAEIIGMSYTKMLEEILLATETRLFSKINHSESHHEIPIASEICKTE